MYTLSSTIIKKIWTFVCHYIIIARSLLNWKKKTQTRNLTVFMVLVIWPSSTLKFLFVSINFNWFFLLISINVWAIFSLRNRRQITFVRVNGFCALNKPTPSHPPVLNGQNQAGWNPKQNWMKYTCLLVHSLSSFEGTSCEKIRDTASLPVPLFLVILNRISFYISRYHFFTTFQKRIQHCLEKDFRSKFSFFNGFTHSPQPLNGQKPVSVTKIFCWCSLNLENFWFYIWAVIVWILISQYKWLYVTSYPCPWIKYLSAKTIKYILKCWERSVKRKSNISFRVIKNSSFDQRFHG